MAVDIKDPRTLIGCAVYAGKNRYIGTVAEVVPPDIEFGSVENGVGVKRDTPIPILEAMKATIKIDGPGEALYEETSKQLAETSTITVRNDTTTIRHDSIDVTFGGRVKIHKNPLPKAGEKMETELEMSLDLYIYRVNGKKYVEIDAINHVLAINGKDLLAETRANL